VKARLSTPSAATSPTACRPRTDVSVIAKWLRVSRL
jgi:hypothetical protein